MRLARPLLWLLHGLVPLPVHEVRFWLLYQLMLIHRLAGSQLHGILPYRCSESVIAKR